MQIVQIFSKSSMNKIFLILILFISSCAAKTGGAKLPDWYISPKQNDASYLKGVAEGNTLEEATRYALADAAARLMVTISSESNMIREENQNSVNEEMRQNVRQNIEKIDFNNFEVTRSTRADTKFYVEVQIERSPFIRQQKEKIDVLEKKISDLEKNSANKNALQKRNDLINALSIGKELELRARIVSGAGENIDLKSKLNHVANLENQLNKISDKIEFFILPTRASEVSQVVRSALNKEKIAVSQIKKDGTSGQISLKISMDSKQQKIYEAFITKLSIDFENSIGTKILASKKIEVTGSSTISAQESQRAAVKSFEEKIEQDGSLKTLGILN